MTIYVKVKVNSYKLTWPSSNYIDKHKKYNLKCKIRKEDLEIIFDKYELKLTGKKKNIELYLGYLQGKKFKFVQIPSKFQVTF